jgi:predicted nucleic acid-binding Zn ribbon protein
MENFYCEYCGKSFKNVAHLTSDACKKHPNGFWKGKHKLYEGGEKSQYTCKYCGKQFSNLVSLTSDTCKKHPDGFWKGTHAPAL